MWRCNLYIWFVLCFSFCIILPKILIFIFSLHLGGCFVERLVFLYPNIPVCQKEVWICTLRVLKNVLAWQSEFVGRDQWKEVSARILQPPCCFHVSTFPEPSIFFIPALLQVPGLKWSSWEFSYSFSVHAFFLCSSCYLFQDCWNF